MMNADLKDLKHYPDWPAAMRRPVALAYTSVSEEQMQEWERDGTVRFVAGGSNGATLALRQQLDQALRWLFDGPAEDLRFADE